MVQGGWLQWGLQYLAVTYSTYIASASVSVCVFVNIARWSPSSIAACAQTDILCSKPRQTCANRERHTYSPTRSNAGAVRAPLQNPANVCKYIFFVFVFVTQISASGGP